jgi:hypothetical protein
MSGERAIDSNCRACPVGNVSGGSSDLFIENVCDLHAKWAQRTQMNRREFASKSILLEGLSVAKLTFPQILVAS